MSKNIIKVILAVLAVWIVSAMVYDTYSSYTEAFAPILEPKLELTMEATPGSGTEDAPAAVLAGAEIVYTVTITNVSDEVVENISAIEHSSRYLEPQDGKIMAHFDDDEAVSIPWEELDRVQFSMASSIDQDDERSLQTFHWEIDSLEPNESFTVIIPAVVSDDVPVETVVRNSAGVTAKTDISDEPGRRPVLSSGSTYHVVRAEGTDETPIYPIITRSSDADEYTQVGDEIQFTLSINNPNDFDIHDFTINEELPRHITLVEGSIQLQRRTVQLLARMLDNYDAFANIEEDVVIEYVDGEIQATFSTLPPGYTYIIFNAIVEELVEEPPQYTVTILGDAAHIADFDEDGNFLYNRVQSREFAPGATVYIVLFNRHTTECRGPFIYFREVTAYPSVDFTVESGDLELRSFVMPASDIEISYGWFPTISIEGGTLVSAGNSTLPNDLPDDRYGGEIRANQPESGYRFARWEIVSGDESLRFVDETAPVTHLLTDVWNPEGVIRAVFEPISVAEPVPESRSLEIAMESSPASGTAEDPTMILPGSVINYSITITNTGEDPVNDVVAQNLMSVYLGIASLRGFFDEDEAADLGELGISHYHLTERWSGEDDGGMRHGIYWTIGTLAPGQSFTLVLEVVVNEEVEEGTSIGNEAQLNDHALGRPRVATYHEVGEADQESPEQTSTVKITMTSTPENGTTEHPTMVFPESVINYSITITNTGEEPVRDVVAQNLMSMYLGIASIRGYFNEDEAVDLGELGISHSHLTESWNGEDGGGMRHGIYWTIRVLEPGESFTLELSTIVLETAPAGRFIGNMAQLNDHVLEPPRFATYHVVGVAGQGTPEQAPPSVPPGQTPPGQGTPPQAPPSVSPGQRPPGQGTPPQAPPSVPSGQTPPSGQGTSDQTSSEQQASGQQRAARRRSSRRNSNSDEREARSKSNPPNALPQTGVAVGLSVLGGAALLTSGLAVASKKKKSR